MSDQFNIGGPEIQYNNAFYVVMNAFIVVIIS